MRAQRGFTLTELLVVIAIAAILAAIAGPNFRSMMLDNRLTAATNGLIAYVSLARSEAIKRRVDVVLCPRDPAEANPTCSGDPDDWNSGYLVYGNVCAAGEVIPVFDAGTLCDTDGDGVDDSSDTLIKVSEGLSGALTLSPNGVASTFLSFGRDGSSNMGAGTARFAVCDERGGEVGRQINIGLVGRPQLEKGTDDEPISCNAPT